MKLLYRGMQLVVAMLVGIAIGWIDANQMLRRKLAMMRHPSFSTIVNGTHPRLWIITFDDQSQTDVRCTKRGISSLILASDRIVKVTDDDGNEYWSLGKGYKE